MEISINEKRNIFQTKPICQNSFKSGVLANNGLKNDVFIKNNLSFKGIDSEIFLGLSKKFGVREYKKLSLEKIKLLRKDLSKELKKDRDAAITLSRLVKKGMDKKYPQGYVIVSFNRNNSTPLKALEYQGIEVKYCPINLPDEIEKNSIKDLISSLPSEKVTKYKKYLDSIGLSAQKINNSDKKYIFIEDSLSELKHFPMLMERPEIGIKSKNIEYKHLAEFILDSKNMRDYLTEVTVGKEKMSKFDLMNQYLLWKQFNAKQYSHYDILSPILLDRAEIIMNKKQTLESKQMQFALIDYFKQKGLLK